MLAQLVEIIAGRMPTPRSPLNGIALNPQPKARFAKWCLAYGCGLNDGNQCSIQPTASRTGAPMFGGYNDLREGGLRMTINWNEPGYPSKHFEVVRAARQFATGSIVIFGVLFTVLFAGTLVGPIPAWAVAIAAAVFLLFGLLNGLGSYYDAKRHVRIIPYFQHRVGEIDTFLAGQMIARFLKQLDEIAATQNVRPISSYGFADDLAGETLQWHEASAGLESVVAVKSRLAELQTEQAISQPIIDELQKWQDALERAVTKKVLFCVLLRHGNSTSGHEWDVRKGSAF